MLGLLDTFLLWTNLGISILVLVSAAYLGLPLKQALLATVVGALIGNAMLATAALIGADARVPTMVLQRAPLGRRGSYLATGLNVLQCLGWSIFELIIIATAASALADRAFGFDALPFWKLLFGGIATALALLGPIGFVRRFVRKFAIWAVAASIVYLAWWIPAHGHLHRLWNGPGQGGSFFAGMDLVIALTVSWIPLVADYTRFSTPAASPSGVPASATSSPRCSSSASARSSSSPTRRSPVRSTSSPRSRPAVSPASWRCSR